METRREVKLDSGSTLKVAPAAFPASKRLYQAILKEMKGVQIYSLAELPTVLKDVFCLGFASPEIEKCLYECFKNCTIDSGGGEIRITEDSFERVEARQDYIQVCIEVAEENVRPFLKSLYAQYLRLLSMTESTPA